MSFVVPLPSSVTIQNMLTSSMSARKSVLMRVKEMLVVVGTTRMMMMMVLVTVSGQVALAGQQPFLPRSTEETRCFRETASKSNDRAFWLHPFRKSIEVDNLVGIVAGGLSHCFVTLPVLFEPKLVHSFVIEFSLAGSTGIGLAFRRFCSASRFGKYEPFVCCTRTLANVLNNRSY
jgi:hypothetical protein